MNKTVMRYVLDARTITPHFPGIGRYVFNLAQSMRPWLRPDETLFLLSDPSQQSHWNLTALACEQVQLVEVNCSPFSLRQQWIIPRLLRQLQINLYHCPYYLMPYRPGVPTILTVYDFIPFHYPHYYTVKARLLYRLATALALRTADHLTAISQATRQDLLAHYHYAPEKITAIPLAADPVFHPKVADHTLNLPEQYALYLGSNKPHKNLLRLIESWAKLQPQAMPLVIAGAWDARYPETRQRVEELGLNQAIRFFGAVAETDLPTLYQRAKLFIFPSEYEGFGLPVLEAMACGTPVACSNSSSLPEVAGEAALMFDPTNVAEMAETLNRLLTNEPLQTKLRELGLRQAACFSWQRTAQETLNLYRTVSRP